MHVTDPFRSLLPAHLIAKTPIERPIDPDTGEPIPNTMNGIGTWSPINGDVAAATFAQENGAYVE